jgi:hypothetical protein
VEFQTTQARDDLAAIDFDLTTQAVRRSSLEVRALLSSDTVGASELGARTLRDPAGSIESLAMPKADAGAPAENLAKARKDLDARSEWGARLAGDAGAWNEILAVQSSEVVTLSEWLTGGARVTITGALPVEFADPPALVLVSPERVLRSPGRIRILAGVGSLHPLRDQ